MSSRAFLNWSGGKDSVWALFHYMRRANFAEQNSAPQGLGSAPTLLVTNLTQAGEVTMHGVPEALVRAQAEAIGLPIKFVRLNEVFDNGGYGNAIHHLNVSLRNDGFTRACFGDLFLGDLRRYKENLYGADNMQVEFPIWGMDSWTLLRSFVTAGFKAIVTAVQSDKLSEEFCGRIIDDSFIRDLPAGVDPCGENGEYHSFVFDGPIFKKPVPYSIVGKTFRSYQAPKKNEQPSGNAQDEIGFWVLDLI